MTVHTPLRADDVRRSYARWAGHYDFTFALFGRKYVKKIVNRLNDETHGRHVLDVGTGTGLSLPYFRHDLTVTGIDISEDMLARAEQRAQRKKLKNIAGLYVMDAGNLQFDDGAFDSVLATFVKSVVPNPAQVLQEIARVTRPGGRVYLLNYLRADEEDNRVLAMAVRAIAPASRKVGFHSDFCRSQLNMAETGFHLTHENSFGPLDMFTLLTLQKAASEI
ncbi:MAG: class I SAM-dependent methyltransferase [Alphaproteobacteria bacterium]|nr:class I SAM-dependent methyltransferase [Alphaproteobacteria bacterium]